MFTVKHISAHGGEALHQTTEVSWVPPDTETSVPPREAQVWLKRQDGRLEPLSHGAVYVMNDTGATVAKYDLGGWPGLPTAA